MPQIQQAESRVADLRRDLEYYAGDKDAERQLGSQVKSWQQKADDHRPRVAAIHAELQEIESQKTLP
jgi:predicted  nucleic acid-binding Zn-ribbon protein